MWTVGHLKHPASQTQQWQVTSNQPFNDKNKLTHDSDPVYALPCQISWWLVHHVAQWTRNYKFFKTPNFGNSHTHPFQSLIKVKFGMWVGGNLWSAVLCKVHTVATVWRNSCKFDQIVNFGGSCSYHLHQSGPNIACQSEPMVYSFTLNFTLSGATCLSSEAKNLKSTSHNRNPIRYCPIMVRVARCPEMSRTVWKSKRPYGK